MAQNDLLKRSLDAGVAFTQLTQAKAEEIVRDLVRTGEVRTEDARRRVEELVERSRQNTEGIAALVRAEVQSQVSKLGLVPRSELEAVQRELDQVKAERAATAAKAPSKKVTPPAKAAKKAPATKKAPAAKKSTAKRPATKKA